MIHHIHDSVLIPPIWLLDTLDFTLHDDDLASRNKLATTIGRPQVWRYASGGDLAVQGLGQTVDHFGALAGGKSRRWARSQDVVPVEVDNKGIARCGEERTALGGDTENVRAWLIDQVLGMAGMHDGGRRDRSTRRRGRRNG